MLATNKPEILHFLIITFFLSLGYPEKGTTGKKLGSCFLPRTVLGESNFLHGTFVRSFPSEAPNVSFSVRFPHGTNSLDRLTERYYSISSRRNAVLTEIVLWQAGAQCLCFKPQFMNGKTEK